MHDTEATLQSACATGVSSIPFLLGRNAGKQYFCLLDEIIRRGKIIIILKYDNTMQKRRLLAQLYLARFAGQLILLHNEIKTVLFTATAHFHSIEYTRAGKCISLCVYKDVRIANST